MANRIVGAIVALDTRLAVQLDSSNDVATVRGQQAAMHKTFDMDFETWSMAQDKKSLAFASGVLTLDEANSVYLILGGSPEAFNKGTLAQKVIVTKVLAELLAGGQRRVA